MLDILSSLKGCIEKNWTHRDGENHLQLLWIFQIDAGKNNSAGKPRRSRNCAFSVVYISREHYPFWLNGHVAMVRFKFQLTDVENKCYQ